MLKSIGKYELKRVLGKGASATVYLGVDTFTNAEVAVKVIDTEVFKNSSDGEVLRAQFLNEASLAGKLNHPHIVSILDAVVTEDSGHIAMEYVGGGDLTQRTSLLKLYSTQDAIQVGFKCCGALDYAYRQGVIHRDIKPANIMITKGTDIKIADFGAAYLRHNADKDQASMGTPSYMSPEQMSGAELTHQSDMFSWAIVLYELFTGEKPFVAKTMSELVRKIQREDPVPPSRNWPSIPPAIDRVLLTALAKKPADRFPTWADFALELAKIGGLSYQDKSIQDSEKYAALRRVKMLSKLADGQIWELVRAGRWTRESARHVIIRENDTGNSLFFLAAGQVKATRQGRLLNLIEGGECFGEMAYIRGGKAERHASVESMTQVMYAEFPSEALDGMSDSCQLHFMRALVSTLAERLDLANSRLSPTKN